MISVLPKSTLKVPFFISCANVAGLREVSVRILYCSEQDKARLSEKGQVFETSALASIDFTKPFLVAFDLHSIPHRILDSDSDIGLLDDQMQTVKKQSWILTCQIQNSSSYELQLDLDQISIVKDEAWLQGCGAQVDVDFVGKQFMERITLCPSESLNVSFNISVRLDALSEKEKLHMGDLNVRWRKTNTKLWSTYKVALSPFHLFIQPLIVCADFPKTGNLGSILRIEYLIQNISLKMEQIDVQMEPMEAFVFSGYRSIKQCILPLSSKKLVYNFVPLKSGKWAVPKIKLFKDEKEREDIDYLQSAGQEFILVNPSEAW
jgi:hypothetical protein